MYNPTTRSFTLAANFISYSWIWEGCDPADYQEMTDEEIYAWIDREIDFSKENDIRELEEFASTRSYPLMGYRTDEIFKSPSDYIEARTQQVHEDYAEERPYVFKAIKKWIAGDQLFEDEEE